MTDRELMQQWMKRLSKSFADSDWTDVANVHNEIKVRLAQPDQEKPLKLGGMEQRMFEQECAFLAGSLAQPEQEPVAWYHAEDYKTHFTTDPDIDLTNNYWQPLYAALPQPEPPCKTGSQCVGGKCERCAVQEPVAYTGNGTAGREADVRPTGFFIQADRKPEPEPVATLFGSLPVYDVPPAKPVAWVENLENARPHCVTDLKYCSVAQHERGEHLKYIPLYPAPPQREWQGLTDEEQLEIMKMFGLGQRGAFADAIEAKLKEKNYGNDNL